MRHKLNLKSLKKNGILPLQMDENQLLCKVRYPASNQILYFLNYFSQLYHRDVHIEWVDEKTFMSDLECFQGQPIVVDTQLIQKSVVKKLEQIIFQAYDKWCSDVHFEAHRHGLKVFVRQQGQYHFVEDLPLTLQRPLFNSIKLKALLDPSDIRHPQNGQFTLSRYPKQVYCRISTLPGLHGESIVVRLHLPQDQAQIVNVALFKTPFVAELDKLHPGLFLITGPIGSGKTTTYYTLLNRFNHQRVLSLEDPIEIPQPGIVQLRLDLKTKKEDFMRLLLRQSINMIGIGEIRTFEHLKLAVNAALTGHCVLATFHASSIADITHRLETFGYSKAKQPLFLRNILFQSWNISSGKRNLCFC